MAKSEAAKRCAEYRAKNPEKVAADNARRKQRLCRRSKNRWAMILHHVKRRTNYYRLGRRTHYQKNGIECRLTVIEIARVWFRDKAYFLIDPHLDRVDPDGHYEFSNVRFIESWENLARIRRPEREPGEEG